MGKATDPLSTISVLRSLQNYVQKRVGKPYGHHTILPHPDWSFSEASAMRNESCLPEDWHHRSRSSIWNRKPSSFLSSSPSKENLRQQHKWVSTLHFLNSQGRVRLWFYLASLKKLKISLGASVWTLQKGHDQYTRAAKSPKPPIVQGFITRSKQNSSCYAVTLR